MTVTTFSSREFNHDAGKAKRAAIDGPVFITDRGQPAYVLLTFKAYKKIRGSKAKIADLLAMPGIEDIEPDSQRPRDRVQPANFN